MAASPNGASTCASISSSIERGFRESPGPVRRDAAVFKLRSNGYRGRIVALSATSTGTAQDASLRAGADYYLTKSFNVGQFFGVMRRAVQE